MYFMTDREISHEIDVHNILIYVNFYFVIFN